MEVFYQVAVNAPIKPNVLTYKYSDKNLQRGDLVNIPLGRRKEKGIILEQVPEPNVEFKLKEIEGQIEGLRINDPLLELLVWMQSYYHYPLGKLVFDILPKVLKRPRELNFYKGNNHQFPFDLNEPQNEIYLKIRKELSDGFQRSLIHGVTGSGKTAIYLRLIKDVNELGKSVLFLLPEINLTSQFIESFQEVLETKIYTYNSAISNSDRFGLWKVLEDENEPVVIIGVRSSIFLPIRNLGMIIVDEEHDGSFKQDDRCPYHARDVAIKRAAVEKIPVVLGSATPSLETLKATQSTDSYYVMKDRVSGAKKPEIVLLDMRNEEDFGDHWPLGKRSITVIQDALEEKEQLLIFINRLGFSSFIQCKSCGHQFFCLNCSTPLKYFKRKNKLTCQHCTYEEPLPGECPKCGSLDLLHRGFGTEKIAEVVSGLFPEARVGRFDRDEIKTHNALEQRLNEFHKGEIDILIGTQMLSKGHNFRRVNKVLILGTDSQLSYPDFRSQEKVFQMVSQVSGRAGRYSDKGKVYIQTLLPSLNVYQSIQLGKEDEFLKEELSLRESVQYPPFARIVTIYFSSRFLKNLENETLAVQRDLMAVKEKAFKDVEIFGPMACMLEKRANQFTWQFMLRSENVNSLHNLLNTFENNYKPSSSISYKIDVDPQFFT